MTQFLVLFYSVSCLNASLGANAPYNDLKFVLQMMDYRAVVNKIAKTALQKVLKKSLVFNRRIGRFCNVDRFCDVQQQPIYIG